MILEDNKFRIFWDIFITGALVFVCTMMPFHIAFDMKSYSWCVIYYLIDSFFLLDIIIIFFTSLPSTDDKEEITDRWVIAKSYLTGWFFVDLLAIMPFDVILTAGSGNFDLCKADDCIVEESPGSESKVNILLRAPKLQKIMKSIRLFRMVKLIKLVKNS